MTHVLVTRAMLITIATFIAAAVAFGCLANRPPQAPASGTQPAAPPPGEALFETYCSGCHTIEEVVSAFRQAPDSATGRRTLATLLKSHGDASDEQDAAVVDYVASR